MITESQVHDAFKTIIANREAKALNYAVNYAKVGLELHGEDLFYQVLYVLNNMTRWRGTEAKAVRDTLKAFVEQKASANE